jgi:hypothetical protein
VSVRGGKPTRRAFNTVAMSITSCRIAPATCGSHRLLQYQRPFKDQWEFVEYAQKHQPQLDLLTPPKRPEPKP